MGIPLRVLIIEDSDGDVALEVRSLKAAGYQVTYAVAQTATEMKAALLNQAFDIVISDHGMPQFDAPGALAVLKQSGLDIPFIIVSGSISEETAVALIKAGAHDYVMKDRLPRLVPAIQRELREAESRRERKRESEALRESEKKYRLLADNVNDVICILDMNLNYTYISPSIKILR
ncbi:MAG: response regulator, partial [Smithellaceae bacterium]|nr:response regulator [Smithellaceae bacterium]